MASTDQQQLLPDPAILAAIFPSAQVSSHRVISNTFDTCTFVATLAEDAKLTEVVVRLEKSPGSRLAVVAALQKIASTQIPHIVPSTLKVGKVRAEDGTDLDFSVTEYCHGTVTLESVWNDLDQDQRASVTQTVVDATRQLHNVRLEPASDEIKRELKGTPFLDDTHQPISPVGGPSLGYFDSLTALVTSVIQPANPAKAPYSFVSDDDGTIKVTSIYPEFGQVSISTDDFDELQKSCVFCHNDMEPRNLLVRQTGSGYELAAIIDWEMAGFIPFALETGLKDTFLGLQNLSFSFYSLYKEMTAHLIPTTGPSSGEAHLKLIRAVRLAKLSKKRKMKRQVGAQVQKKWLEREKVELASDVRRGWVRKDGAGDVGPFTEKDKEAMEQEVLKELGYI
ncbi:hypothetical protein ACJ41O_003681 [Fusarium nematophilum]